MKGIGEMINESFKAAEPDVEIVVRSGEQEIAVLGFFQNKSGVWDVIVGVDDRDRRDQLLALFSLATSALQIASFDALRTSGVSERLPLDDEPSGNYYQQEKEVDPKKR